MTAPIDLVDEVAALRSEIDASLVDDLPARTLALLERLWRLRPGPASAGFITSRVSRLDRAPLRRSARIAIVRSFTVEPLVPLVRAAGLVNGLDLAVDVGGFNTFAQDLLDPGSFLGSDDYDVIIVATQTRDVAPELWSHGGTSTSTDNDAVVERVVSQFRAMIEEYRSRGSSHLLVHGLEQPVWPAMGLADQRATSGQTAAIDRINTGLRELEEEFRDVHVLDYDRLIADAGRRTWHDEAKWASMRMPLRAESMPHVANAWMRHLAPMLGHVAKALVVDLDNTLWGGVVGELGVDGIELGDKGAGLGYVGLQQSILDLRTRGILLAVCSKNNEADAMEALETHPAMRLRPSHFTAIYANWNDKAHNLRQIAADLDIGLDAIVFLDDNPAECELIRHELPEVTVIELERPPLPGANPIIGHPLFERLRLADEDLRRNQMYAEQRERRELKTSTASLEDYLMSLGTEIDVHRMRNDEIPRVAQLTQKTNQLNLTTRRCSAQQIAQMKADPAFDVYSAVAGDRFGEHGLIGVAIVRKNDRVWTLENFLLSCRVIGRGVESAMMSVIAHAARAAGAESLVGHFIPTAKNAPAAAILPSHGFAAAEDPERFVLPIGGDLPATPPWITMHTSGGDDDE